MKAGPVLTILGIVMIICGLILFYSIQSDPNLDQSLRIVKLGGTFVGLMGIGIMTAGILLYLIEREQPPIQEDFDV